jgi:hypothetical protein
MPNMNVTKKRVRLALALAMLADVLQLGILPLLAEGVIPYVIVNDVMDVVVAVAMILLIGWHWAFLPSFALELVPALNLVPTWTAAVLFVTRGSRAASASELAAVRQAGAAVLPGTDAAGRGDAAPEDDSTPEPREPDPDGAR